MRHSSLLRGGERKRDRLILLAALGVSGCGTLPDGRRWGEDATPFPGLGRIGHAALRAALDPATWAPAAGALLFIPDGWDRKVSNWASERTPLFGSQATAADASDILNQVQLAGTVLTALAAPSGGEPGEWLFSKAKGVTVEAGAVLINEGVDLILKPAVGRVRPNGEGHESFPSDHASFSSTLAALSSRNVESLSLPWGAEAGLKAGFYSMAAATAWARVEAHEHFPSDVLAGSAIGHFLGVFIHDAFLGLPERSGPWFEVSPAAGGAMLEVAWSF